jgi:hypothetical protein
MVKDKIKCKTGGRGITVPVPSVDKEYISKYHGRGKTVGKNRFQTNSKTLATKKL